MTFLIPTELVSQFGAYIVDTYGIEWVENPEGREYVRAVLQDNLMIVRPRGRGAEVWCSDPDFLKQVEADWFAVLKLEFDKDVKGDPTCTQK